MKPIITLNKLAQRDISFRRAIVKETEMKNFKVKAIVRVDGVEIDNPVNPYRRGTSKRALFGWALEQESFTKAEFITAAIELKHGGEVESVMADETMAKAWWNEFYSKYTVFQPISE